MLGVKLMWLLIFIHSHLARSVNMQWKSCTVPLNPLHWPMRLLMTSQLVSVCMMPHDCDLWHLVTMVIIKAIMRRLLWLWFALMAAGDPHLLAPPPLTHLFLTDKQLVSSQNHKTILPDLSEDPLSTELPDPAHFVRRRVLRHWVRWNLNRKQEAVRAGKHVEKQISVNRCLQRGTPVHLGLCCQTGVRFCCTVWFSPTV